MTIALANSLRRGLMGPRHARDIEVGLGKRAGALTEAEKGQARANVGADLLGGFRNKIINGDFGIWQRGASFTGASGYTADRWRVSADVAGAAIVSRQSFVNGQTSVPGNPNYFLRLKRAALSELTLRQKIEGVNTLAGRKVTYTAFLRSGVPLTVNLIARQEFGTGGTPSANVDQTFPVALTSLWTKFSFTVDLASTSGKTIGCSGGDALTFLLVWPSSSGGATDQIDIAHVSVVEGDATAEADPFSPRHIGQELVLCQRYFFRSYDWQGGHAIRYGTAGSLRDGGVLPFPVTMRAAPTTTIVVAPAFLNCSAPVWGAPNPDMAALRLTVTATGDYRAWGGEYHFDAEL